MYHLAAQLSGGGFMVDVRIRGGSFPPGGACVFRDDHFRFGQKLFSSPTETIYIGAARGARIIDTKDPVRAKNTGAAVLGGAGVGALAGSWFGPPGAAIGGAMGAIVGYTGRDGEKQGELTFEFAFADGRTLVGTVNATGWQEILDAWRISAKITRREPTTVEAPPSAGCVGASEIKALPPAATGSDQKPEGIVERLRGLTFWNNRR